MTIDEALQTQHALEQKLADARQRFDEAHASISKIAFAAHATDDAEAKKRLSALHLEKAKFAAEIDSISVALKEAQRRVAGARAAEAEGLAAEKAQQALSLCDSFLERGAALDRALESFIEEYNGLARDFRQLDALGFAPTSFALVAIQMRRATETRLMGTDLKITHLAPRERKTFVECISGWAQNVKNRAEARLTKSDAAGKAA
jgi:hypothetical protein